jgi:putative spermidine/putrescine transport system ATP-binding protein
MDDALRVTNLHFAYGPNPILRDVSLTIPRGSLFTLLGPSGCGKSTLLKLLGGYRMPRAGQVILGPRDITHAAPETRNIGIVFQNYALFPHLSAWKNVAFGLEVRRYTSAEIQNQVEQMLQRVRLDAEAWHRLPSQLSGGQQQRVALARALVIRPDLLLLDEPLTNLDRQLRNELRTELRRVQAETGTTTLLVTHDQEEALSVSDQVAVMRAGEVLQVGSPREVYLRPRTPFVARFLGEANILPGESIGFPPNSLVSIRPELVRRGGARTGRVTSLDYRGSECLATIRSEQLDVTIRITTIEESVHINDTICFDLPRESCWFIPERDNA